MSRLALVGYGRMGRLVEQLAPAHGFEVALRLDGRDNAGGQGIAAESWRGIDVAIDFSTARAVRANAERIAALGSSPPRIMAKATPAATRATSTAPAIRTGFHPILSKKSRSRHIRRRASSGTA